METPMTEWNDDRLDELKGRMKDGFAEVDKRFVRLEGEMKRGFEKASSDLKQESARLEWTMNEGFAELKAEIRQMGDRLEKRIDRVSNRLDRFMFTMFAAGAGVLIAALNGGLS